MRPTLKLAGIIFVCVAVGMQLVPSGTATKTVGASDARRAEMIDPRVAAIVDRSCQDCHSNQTRLPWYGHVAPVSWILSRDVRKGRAKLDFSQWAERPHSANERMEICDAVSDGSMPLRAYTVFHRTAKLSKQDVDVMCDWAAAPTGNAPAQRASGLPAVAETLTSSNNVHHANMKGSR